MRSSRRLIRLAIYLFLSIGMICETAGQNLSRKKSELITSQVDSVFQEMLVFAENLDLKKLSLGVDDRHGAGFISGGKYHSTFASLLERMESQVQDISRQQIVIGQKKITVLTDTIVLLTATGEATAIADDGRQIKANFDWSFIYQKYDKNWKVIYSHQSLAQANP